MAENLASNTTPLWAPAKVSSNVEWDSRPGSSLQSAVSVEPASEQDDEPEGDRRGPLRPQVLTPARSRLTGAMLTRVFSMLDNGLLWLIALAVISHGDLLTTLALRLNDIIPLAVGLAMGTRSLRAFGAYNFVRREGLAHHLGAVAMGLSLTCGASLALGQVFGDHAFSLCAAWCFWASLAVLICHAIAWFRVRQFRAQGRLTPNIVIVGATENAVSIIEAALANREIAILGIFDDRLDRAPQSLSGVPVLGDTTHLLGHRILPYVDRIVITVTAASQPRVRQLMERLRYLPNAVTLFVEGEGRDGGQDALTRMAQLPLSHVSGSAFDERRILLKRVQDVVLASLALMMAAPAMALIALAVRLDSPGPIFFKQKRHGFNNEPIEILKFRSMHHPESAQSAIHQVQEDDVRVTRLGHFIRMTSLDELPQLFNVLRGEMSLVGPRPHAIGMRTGSEESAKLVAEYAWRHRMKPGITGWAQVNGSRGPIHTPEAVRTRVALDIDYIERQSFWLDIYILLKTLPILIGDRCVPR